ncbi:MAG: class I SAM-dependent methyltransferase [Candidatus Bathyarchaeota archaeon]|nr:class I SAM-dependent methyltransferase [Candidatus Bathyarchaeota archaeon]
MSSSHEKGWDGAYHRYPLKRLPWELGRPREVLVDLVESGRVRPCETLDLCCGAGTNPTYLAERGFNVTALDISDRAVELTIGRAHRAGININILIGDFVNLPYIDEMFNFVFDFGCFHHVEMGNRSAFINGVHRVLKSSGTYLMVCFSERNGRAWNHFSGEQIIELFSDHFEIESIDHVSSLEGDEVERYFYEVFMKKSYEKKTPSFV